MAAPSGGVRGVSPTESFKSTENLCVTKVFPSPAPRARSVKFFGQHFFVRHRDKSGAPAGDRHAVRRKFACAETFVCLNSASMNDLRSMIRAKGVRQRDIADALGVSEPTISRWADRRGAIPVGMVLPLAALLDVTAEDVLAVAAAASKPGATQDAAA